MHAAHPDTRSPPHCYAYHRTHEHASTADAHVTSASGAYRHAGRWGRTCDSPTVDRRGRRGRRMPVAGRGSGASRRSCSHSDRSSRAAGERVTPLGGTVDGQPRQTREADLARTPSLMAEDPYNPVVRCHAGKTAGFVLAERHLTFPSDSAKSAGCGPNGKPTFNPGVVGSNPSRPSKVSTHRQEDGTAMREDRV